MELNHFRPNNYFNLLLGIIFILFLLHLTAFFAAYFNLIHYNDFFFQKLNFDEEKNLPSAFSSAMHLTAAVLLALIGASSFTKDKSFWWILSFTFVFLAADELLRIHEMAGRYLSQIIDTSGIFHYSWIIPYGFAVIVLGLIMLKPLLKLPTRTRNRFIFSGAVFLLGAVGMEMITGWLITQHELENSQLIIRPEFFILYTIEELLEMLGLSYFIYSLLDFRKLNNKNKLAHQFELI